MQAGMIAARGKCAMMWEFLEALRVVWIAGVVWTLADAVVRWQKGQ